MSRTTHHLRPPVAARLGFWLGPALLVLLLVVPTGSLTGDARKVLAVMAWMAVWWVSEAAPLAITALLPLVLLPLLAVRSVAVVAPSYGHHIIFLFLGGFVLAVAVELSGLHRRLALAILDSLGCSPRRLVWGFLLATAVLSMWLSNTATALMILPIAIGVGERLEQKEAVRLFLAVAYGASAGGIGTLIGTPPNLVLAGMATELVPGLRPLTFGGWLLFGLPLVAVLLPLIGLQLCRGLAAGTGHDDSGIRAQRQALGPVRPAERRVAVLFALTALAWVTRSDLVLGGLRLPGWGGLLPAGLVKDAVPAIAAAIVASLVPAGEADRSRLVQWEEVQQRVPWGILLLFGGGFALADAVHSSGLDSWLAGQLHGLAGLPLPLVVLLICLLTTAATELTSNTATATLLMPVMAALAVVLEVPPYLLMVPAVVSASCAFMLPVATPPNAIVIGSGQVRTREMVREGIWLNLTAALATTLMVLTVGRWVLQ